MLNNHIHNILHFILLQCILFQKDLNVITSVAMVTCPVAVLLKAWKPI